MWVMPGFAWALHSPPLSVGPSHVSHVHTKGLYCTAGSEAFPVLTWMPAAMCWLGKMAWTISKSFIRCLCVLLFLILRTLVIQSWGSRHFCETNQVLLENSHWSIGGDGEVSHLPVSCAYLGTSSRWSQYIAFSSFLHNSKKWGAAPAKCNYAIV